jgi:hypothetical protein
LVSTRDIPTRLPRTRKWFGKSWFKSRFTEAYGNILLEEHESTGVGHAAIALGAARAVPRVNAGWLVFAAFLADFLLGIFAIMGFEQAHVPGG